MKSLVVYSYHHNNTLKVAQVMAKVLDADVKSPQETVLDELARARLSYSSALYPQNSRGSYVSRKS